MPPTRLAQVSVWPCFEPVAAGSVASSFVFAHFNERPTRKSRLGAGLLLVGLPAAPDRGTSGSLVEPLALDPSPGDGPKQDVSNMSEESGKPLENSNQKQITKAFSERYLQNGGLTVVWSPVATNSLIATCPSLQRRWRVPRRSPIPC